MTQKNLQGTMNCPLNHVTNEDYINIQQQLSSLSKENQEMKEEIVFLKQRIRELEAGGQNE